MHVDLGPYCEDRLVYVKYHNYDTWNLDHTLALIILPGLRQLKETNHGFAHVNNLNEIGIELPSNIQENSIQAWEWVQDEMIFAMENILDDDQDILDFELQNRINRGLLLFGRYFRALWD